MFKRKKNGHLPEHIEYHTYHRDKHTKQMPEDDKTAIDQFYESHNIKYKGLTSYQQVIIFKRTVKFIYIVAHFFDKKSNAKFASPMAGKDKGFGVVRTQAYIFYKDGSLLYEYDWDIQCYEDTHFTRVEEKKIRKTSYELHDTLEEKEDYKIGGALKGLGRSGSPTSFDKKAHELLKLDISLQSVDFVTRED